MASFKRDREYIKSIQRNLSGNADSKLIVDTKLAATTMAAIGIGKALEELGEAKRARIIQGMPKEGKDLQNKKPESTQPFILEDWEKPDQKDIDSKRPANKIPQLAKNWDREDREKGLNIKEKIYQVKGSEVNTNNWQERLVNILNDYGINEMNRWFVLFGNNKSLKPESSTALSLLTTSCTIEGLNITNDGQHLVFDRNRDVSEIELTSFQLNILNDENLLTKRILYKVLNEVRNKYGRYGYKDDYKWDYIYFLVNNNVNDVVFGVKFTDCIISGEDGLTGDYATSDFSTHQITFEYDKMEPFPIIDL